MDSETATAEAIRRCLDMASDQFASTGMLAKWFYQADVPTFAVYTLRYSTFSETGARDVIVVPLVPTSEIQQGSVMDLQGALEKEAKGKAGERQVIFVDCYGKGGLPLGTETKVLKPAELWGGVTTIPEYYENVMSKDTDILQFAATFVDRVVQRSEERNRDEESALTLLDDWVKEEGRRGLAIVGERGSGKTWLLKRFQEEQMKRHSISPWQHPAVVFVGMRKYADCLRNEQGIKKALSHYICEEYHLQSTGGVMLIESLISAGAIILVLDALDELSREVSPRELEALIDDLLDNLPPMARVIITTRETKFLSRKQIREQLSNPHVDIVADETSRVDGVYLKDIRERSHRPLFDIVHLRSFSADDTRELDTKVQKASAVMYGDDRVGNISTLVDWLQTIPASDGEREFLTAAIMSLCRIPACSKQLADARRQTPAHLIHLYETVLIGPLIAFNLRAGRAIREAHIRRDTGDGESTVRVLLNLHKRMDIIDLVARFLLEQGRSEFDIEVLAGVLSEALDDPFDAILTDLRSQSVFEFGDAKEEYDLRFRSDDMLGYFTARHIFRLLSDDSSRREGVQLLGRYSFSHSFQKHILLFLNCFLNHGSVTFSKDLKRERFGTAGEHPRICVDRDSFEQEAVRLVKDGDVYSVWSQYLGQNCDKIGIGSEEFCKHNAWTSNPLKLIDSAEIVISGVESKIDPFVVLPHEVTNGDFNQFLESTLRPVLPEEPNNLDKYPVEFKQKQDCISIHPLHWRNIHSRIAEGIRSEVLGDFLAFTNTYHLFEWTDKGDCPAQLKDHPVVWPSMYICAIYCNWKTCKEMGEEHCFYEVGLRWQDVQKRRVPYLTCRTRREGYRIPNITEWQYAARGGDTGENPWTSLLAYPEESEEHRRGVLLRRSLTRQTTKTHDVSKSRVNGYGIFGMHGNVREWTHMDDDWQEMEHGVIMGGTWALDDTSFDYDDPGAPLPAGNTNLDVGFRVARSLISQSPVIRDAQKRLRGESK